MVLLVTDAREAQCVASTARFGAVLMKRALRRARAVKNLVKKGKNIGNGVSLFHKGARGEIKYYASFKNV